MCNARQISSMPQYFFHLRFELYSTPAANARKQQYSGSIFNHTHKQTSDVYVPATGTDLFKESLPAHRTSKWTRNYFAQQLARGSSPGYGIGGASVHKGSSSEADPVRAGHASETHGDALLLPERSLNLRKDALPPSPCARAGKLSNETAAGDWRYDSVTIESIDMAASKKHDGSGNTGGLHPKAVFLPSETTSTDVGYGVVHLYRDIDEASTDVISVKERAHRGHEHGASNAEPGLEECSTLCILAVPSWMMPSDLLGFVGDQAREDVSHFRLIRTGRANKYMALMKFRSAKKARDWQKANNGRVFSAAEPENCHVVFVKSVDFISPESDTTAAKFPRNNTHDPFTTQGSRSNATPNNLSSKPLAPPPPNLLELPTCPVCLERMDETTGLLTILCQHVFHCACLEKWRGSGCPVCRYTHSPSFTFPYPRPHDAVDGEGEQSEPLCSVCASTSNLWICLICGNIGCGRYDSAHAYAHYEATSHCYAMDVSSQHVWDYAGDGYVHRLIQNKAAHEASSGKGHMDQPARPRHENEAFRAEGGDSVPREKMENMANEYAYLLTSQLEGQRRYFEEQVERAVDKASEAFARADEAATQTTQAHAELEKQRSANKDISETLSRVEKALEKSEKARAKFEQLARDLSAQLREEKTMNEGLLQRVKAADEKAEAARSEAESARREKQELEEMNHDLTAFISAQEKVAALQAQGEEVADGSISVPDPPPPPAGKKNKGKGRKK